MFVACVRVTIVTVEKLIIITYSEFMFVALGYPALKAHASYYSAICGLSVSTIFSPHYLIKGTIFVKKNS